MTKVAMSESTGSAMTYRKEYSCFVCGAKSPDKGIPLLLSETTYSKICLGQKLQEILSNKFIVLIKPKDSVCWDCAEVINWVDKYEIRVDIAKEGLQSQIIKKYKHMEINLTNESSVNIPPAEDILDIEEDAKSDDYRDPSYTPKVQLTSSAPKKKKFPCSVCQKLYTTAAAAGAHAAKVHRYEYTCSVCDKVFATEKKLKSHAVVHKNVPQDEPSKLLSCVSCGFQATNMEVYCRHVCNSAIMSLTCSTCKKRYVGSSSAKGAKYQCDACTKLAEPVEPFYEPLVYEDEKDVTSEVIEPTPSPIEDLIIEGIIPEEKQNGVEEPKPVEDDKIITDPLIPDEIVQEPEENQEEEQEHETFILNEHVSFLKCTNCDEEFELAMLASHHCFARGEAIEFTEVERQVGTYYSVPIFKQTEKMPERQRKRKALKIPAQENNSNDAKMTCKTCDAEFKTIGLMRQHWDLTGHSREVSTTTVELNKIRDKARKTEKTFKVVKQNFHIRANVPGQNDEEIRKSEEMQLNCIVKYKDDLSVEEFIGMRGGKECETCGILFGSEDLLKEHQQINCLTCITCNVTFFDNKLLKKHYQYTGHANRVASKLNEPYSTLKPEQDSFGCHICFKPFFSRFVLGKHLQKHYKGTSKGVCHYCQMEFEDKAQIQQHVLEVHGAKLYQCQHCDRTFLSESVRNRHQVKHKGYPCKVCKSKFSSQRQLLLHIDQSHRKSSSCIICGKVIADRRALKKHEKTHFYGKNLQCDLCGKTFRNKNSLKIHFQVHENDPHFKCDTCFMGFKTEQSLEEHQIVHIKSEYTCPKCSIVCPSKILFWTHMKLHDTAYTCSVCGRTFRDTSLLAIHRRKHWRVRPYQCPHCPRVFSVPATLRRHLTVHTRAYPHRCVLCKKGFLTRYAFHKHLDTVHSVKAHNQMKRQEKKIPSLPLNATDEDLFQAADTLIADDTIMFNDFQQKDVTIEQVPSTDLITTEVVVESTELFDVLT